jgi:N-dimethylarginine dimethylaminohydrolase
VTYDDDSKNDGKSPEIGDNSRKTLEQFPFYEEGKVPQYHRYHDEVSYLDELEQIWGKPWGAQGIGRLREVAMVKPTETEVKKLYEQDSAFFVFNGITPDLELMQEQHLNLAKTYESLGIKVHYVSWAEDPPMSAYGPMKRSISAAAGFVINGGAILPREATPYWRGRSRYVAKFLMSIDCPILYAVHGHGICEIGASTRMSDDFIILMQSTDCNPDGAQQVIPILQNAGYKEVHIAHSPGPLYEYHDEVPGWMHADMWITPLDAKLAMIYPPWCDYTTIRRLHEIGYELIECPRDEIDLFPTNAITVEPRKLIMNESAVKTRKLLEKSGVEVIPVPYDEVHKYGGGIRCNTMQLIRDVGPKTFDNGE